jgi:TPR repeat protein
MATQWDDLKRALVKPEPPNVLATAANALLSCVVRGDCMIGILPIDAIYDVITALRRVAESGLAEGRDGLADLLAALAQQDLTHTTYEADTLVALASLPDRKAKLLAARTWMYREDEEHAEQAIAIAREACDDDDDGRAHVLIGYMTFRGFGTGTDPLESFRLHEIAAQRGNADGMFELYVLLSTGQGVAKDEARALQWCERAAAQDHVRALYNMGSVHATGRGLARDPVRALGLYLRASQAGHGRASAAAGVMLWTGDGTKTDRARARQLFDLAGDQGYEVEALIDAAGITLEE